MIGIFDSGVGGLTALWELRRLRPDLDIVYFGDTAHVPYGTRSPEMIRRFAGEAVGFLSGLGAEAILVACGTVSSVALPALSEHTGCPLFGVVEPAAEVAYRVSKNKKIGILATEATVGSGAFDRALRRLGPVVTRSLACPLFVSLAENGFTAPDDPVARAAAEHYLAPLRESALDTLILGCTHFPLLAAHIHRVLPGVRLIGAGEAAAAVLVPVSGMGNSRCSPAMHPTVLKRQPQGFLAPPCPSTYKNISRGAYRQPPEDTLILSGKGTEKHG